MRRVHIFVSGNVQGVSFRSFVEENALKLNIKGFVRNIYYGERGGQVEAVFEGGEKDIEKMIKMCEKGSTFSEVKKVEVIDEKYTREFRNFKRLY